MWNQMGYEIVIITTESLFLQLKHYSSQQNIYIFPQNNHLFLFNILLKVDDMFN